VTTEPAALELSGISQRFGRIAALDGASLRVRNGTVHALVGENGAGKTTLMRIAFGLLSPDAGTIRVQGTLVRLRSPADAIAMGIGMVHQHFTNVGAMTVAENVALGGHGRLQEREIAARLATIAERTNLVLDPSTRADELPVGAQQRLEILKALARNARLLILDEPTAVLAPAEAADLLAWLRRFAESGGAVVLITHKLREALAFADDVTVLRHGRTVLTAPAASSDARSVAQAMVGDATDALSAPPAAVGDHVVAHAARVTLADSRGAIVLRDASFELRAGEIVGIAAVEGSGQRELLLALAGRLAVSSGTLRVPDNVGFVPEDRHRDGLALDLTLAENVALRGAGDRRGRMRWRLFRDRTSSLIRDFDIRGTAEMRAGFLSGGNQQKLVLARELDGSPNLVIAENPTRGLDIRATAAVHEHLRTAARRGAAVIVYSSDLDEILGLATRMVVLHAGRLHETPVDRDRVGRAMLGVA
jgi:general nucleoside transport system ATP-binding protein